MPEAIQSFLSQPWYFIAIGVVGGAYIAYGFFKNARSSFQEGMDSVNKNEVAYRVARKSTLSGQQQFAIALDAVMTAYWEVDNNTLSFTHNGKKPHQFETYMTGWFISTAEGYRDLRDSFLANGRRGYFSFLYPLFKDVPRAEWSTRVSAEYGDAERPRAMLERLGAGVAEELVRRGVLESEADMELGVLGWDASVLIGQARRAYTAGLITEDEAWDTIETARHMVCQTFGSWRDFGRSQVIGMALDSYRKNDTFFNDFIETYQQVAVDAESPWQRMRWPAP